MVLKTWMIRWIALSLILLPLGALSEPASQTSLDERYQTWLQQYFQAPAANTTGAAFNVNHFTLDQLNAQSTPNSLAFIHQHRNALIALGDHTALQAVLTYLYDHNDTSLIQQFVKQAQTQQWPALTAKHYFLLARYYLARQEWEATLGAIDKVVDNALNKNDFHYLQFMQGLALQQAQNPRKSLNSYQAVPSHSPYFIQAKINQSLANLSQGWWTEAYSALDQALMSAAFYPDAQHQKDLVLTTYGYAKLSQEFYRDARQLFRQVSLKGAYTTGALKGLGLAAGHAKDINAAVNAFERLCQWSSLETLDSHVDDAHLLLPLAYEELNQTQKAGAAFGQSVIYYQKRLQDLNELQQRLQGSNEDFMAVWPKVSAQTQRYFMGANPIPDYLMANFNQLNDFLVNAPNAAPFNDARRLHADYVSHFKHILLNQLQLKQQLITNYLSQAKFGIAKLYDAP